MDFCIDRQRKPTGYRAATAMEIYALKHVFFDQLRLSHISRLSIIIRFKFSNNCPSPIEASGLTFCFFPRKQFLMYYVSFSK
jgi:hypothetical protein